MKRSWLFFLLIFSLALNLASLVSLVYLSRQDVQDVGRRQPGAPLTMKELCRSLPLQAEQCRQFRSMMPEHQQRRQDLQVRLVREQTELWQLMKQDSSSWPAIQGKIKEINSLQTMVEEEAGRLCLEFKKHLQPAQRVVYLKLLERQLLPRREGEGAPLRAGPGWPSRQSQRSKQGGWE
jgi:Spy/CpxP family protein refolding chaperone